MYMVTSSSFKAPLVLTPLHERTSVTKLNLVLSLLAGWSPGRNKVVRHHAQCSLRSLSARLLAKALLTMLCAVARFYLHFHAEDARDSWPQNRVHLTPNTAERLLLFDIC